MKTNCLKKTLFLLMGIVCLGTTASAQIPRNNPYDDPRTKEPGYNLRNDWKPWYKKEWYPFFQEMFDGKGLKPQEEGTYLQFPENSVPVKVVLGKTQSVYELEVPVEEREVHPINAVPVTPESLANGRKMFNTYCGVCHGVDGNGGTPVGQKGMQFGFFPPPIAAMLPVLSEAHLYNKIRYGGPIMPSYGVQTSRKDRWDIVNYLKSSQFGKEEVK